MYGVVVVGVGHELDACMVRVRGMGGQEEVRVKWGTQGGGLLGRDLGQAEVGEVGGKGRLGSRLCQAG